MTEAVDLPSIGAALSAGDFAAAETHCREALRHDPHNADVLLMLAICLHLQKRLEEATDIYARLTRLQPERGIHWANHATALRELADRQPSPEAMRDAAIESYRKALQCEPDNAGTLVNYGLLLLQCHQFPAARDALLRACELDPHTPRTRIHAARACYECGDAAADGLIRSWRQWPALEPDQRLELSRLLLLQGNAEAACEVLDGLLQQHPGHLQARLHRASLYERMHRLDDAAAELDAIDHDPAQDKSMHREVAYQRAVLALRRGDAQAARDLLEDTGPRGEGDDAHAFSLAEAYDKLDDVTAAYASLQHAHALQIAHMKQVAPHRFAEGAPLLTAAVTRVAVEARAHWPTLTAPAMRESPVFVVGFPRSGTTLLEQMLDAHPALQSMDEHPFMNVLADELLAQGLHVPQDLGKLTQADVEHLRRRYRELVADAVTLRPGMQLIDKNPLNMLWLPLIWRLFPRAKIILAVRHPCDVVWSCYMQRFRSSVLAVAGASLERMARTYVAAMEYWLHHVRVFEPDVLMVRYEALVTDIDAEARRIAGFLELDDARTMLGFDVHARRKAYIGTPSYTQVIQPVNRQRVDRWRRYQQYFDPVVPILEPMLKHWGYPVHL